MAKQHDVEHAQSREQLWNGTSSQVVPTGSVRCRTHAKNGSPRTGPPRTVNGRRGEGGGTSDQSQSPKTITIMMIIVAIMAATVASSGGRPNLASYYNIWLDSVGINTSPPFCPPRPQSIPPQLLWEQEFPSLSTSFSPTAHSSTSADVIKASPPAEAFLSVCCALCQGSNFNIKIRLAFGPLRKQRTTAPQNHRAAMEPLRECVTLLPLPTWCLPGCLSANAWHMSDRLPLIPSFFKVSIRNQKLHPCHCATDVPILHIRVTILTTESTDDECTSSALTMHHFECDDIGQHLNIFKF
ncbi:hypothetical protein ACLKA6_014650 [Drosophila palustris]